MPDSIMVWKIRLHSYEENVEEPAEGISKSAIAMRRFRKHLKQDRPEEYLEYRKKETARIKAYRSGRGNTDDIRKKTMN